VSEEFLSTIDNWCEYGNNTPSASFKEINYGVLEEYINMEFSQCLGL
jgi:hypothetical protein